MSLNFVIWIYGFLWIRFPFSVKYIGLCEFECCYLILLCSGNGEPSFECVFVFCRDIAFKADALAIHYLVLVTHREGDIRNTVGSIFCNLIILIGGFYTHHIEI